MSDTDDPFNLNEEIEFWGVDDIIIKCSELLKQEFTPDQFFDFSQIATLYSRATEIVVGDMQDLDDNSKQVLTHFIINDMKISSDTPHYINRNLLIQLTKTCVFSAVENARNRVLYTMVGHLTKN